MTLSDRFVQNSTFSFLFSFSPREAHKGEKKYEVDARSLKIRGIIAGTEEAIVQQDLEKHAIVKFVKMVAGETEAVVEFENGAVSFDTSLS